MTNVSRRMLLKGGIAISASIGGWPPFLSASPAAAQLASQSETNAQRTALDLGGDWAFRRDDQAQGIKERWFSGPLPVGLGPHIITLPGTTDEAHAGHLNSEEPSLSGLYRENIYVGPAWYQREIDVPESWRGKSLTLFLERVHWVTHAWLDGRELGTQESLISPHTYDLGTGVTPGKHLVTLCIDNTLIYDLGSFVSVYYEGTQTNWNGVIGRIEIIARNPVHIASMRVFPDVDRKLARMEVQVRNVSGHASAGSIHFTVRGPSAEPAGSGSVRFVVEREEKTIKAEIPIGPEVKLWDEFTPHLYTIDAVIEGQEDHESVTFGMRKLAIQGTQFTLNGRRLMLRGTLECGVFPLTGYPPTDVDSWRRIYQIEKSYGLNYIRFHSWTPPQAAFTAADIEGIFIQTEGPQANVPTGKILARDQFVERELLRIVDTYGNHPSFALMAIGNEFGGSLDVVTRWVNALIQTDNRHFYTSATSNSMKAESRQFTEDATMRGVHGPGTVFDYGSLMAKENRPFIGHEIGQWTFYPDLDEARKYTGVLKAKNFELVRKDLKIKGMLDQARLFLETTGKQAILLYKDEIETILRTRGYAGFSLLDLHDYPGQGTALIGLLDPFWDSKGLVPPEEHKGYAGATVPLLRISKRTYTKDEPLEAAVDLAHFGAADMANTEAIWNVTDEDGVPIANGSLPGITAKTGELNRLGSFKASLAQAQRASKLTVNISLKNSTVSNKWDVWVYPNRTSMPAMPSDVAVFDSWGSDAKAALAAGEKVMLFPRRLSPAKMLKGSFTPVFWSPVWFNHEPATMGILVNPDHPVFADFPTDLYSNWQWYSLIEGSQSVILDSCPLSYRPLVQVVDNFARNHRLGTVFEAKVSSGKLMVCTLNLNRDAPDKQTPEQRSFMASLTTYLSSAMFAPKQELSSQVLDGVLTPTA
jgi:hypothetical protein